MAMFELEAALQQARAAAAPRLPWAHGPLAAILDNGPLFMPLRTVVSTLSAAQWLGPEAFRQGWMSTWWGRPSSRWLGGGFGGEAPEEEDAIGRKRVLGQWAPDVESMTEVSDMMAKALD